MEPHQFHEIHIEDDGDPSKARTIQPKYNDENFNDGCCCKCNLCPGMIFLIAIFVVASVLVTMKFILDVRSK